MSEKLKPVKPPTTAAERKHWGEITKPPAFNEGLGRKVGGWLVGWLGAWRR